MPCVTDKNYIAKWIKDNSTNKTIIFSRLASGVPTGASLEYMDRVTIGKAMQGRRPF